MFFAVSLGAHRLRLWDFAHRHCSVVKLLGRRVHFVDKLCQRRSVHFSCSSWRLSGLGVYAPNARSTNSLSMARVCGSKKEKEPSSVRWFSWAIHSWIFLNHRSWCSAAEHRFLRGLLPDVDEHRRERDGRDVASVFQGLGTWRASTAADLVTRTCLDDDMVSDQYIVRDLTWTCSCPGTSHRSVEFDLLTEVFGKYSSSKDDDYGYDSHLSNRASAAWGQRRSHHFLRHREELDGEVVFVCA